MAVLAVASFVVVGYAIEIGADAGPTPGDMRAADVASDLRADWLTEIAEVVTVLGSGSVHDRRRDRRRGGAGDQAADERGRGARRRAGDLPSRGPAPQGAGRPPAARRRAGRDHWAGLSEWPRRLRGDLQLAGAGDRRSRAAGAHLRLGADRRRLRPHRRGRPQPHLPRRSLLQRVPVAGRSEPPPSRPASASRWSSRTCDTIRRRARSCDERGCEDRDGVPAVRRGGGDQRAGVRRADLRSGDRIVRARLGEGDRRAALVLHPRGPDRDRDRCGGRGRLLLGRHQPACSAVCNRPDLQCQGSRNPPFELGARRALGGDRVRRRPPGRGPRGGPGTRRERRPDRSLERRARGRRLVFSRGIEAALRRGRRGHAGAAGRRCRGRPASLPRPQGRAVADSDADGLDPARARARALEGAGVGE